MGETGRAYIRRASMLGVMAMIICAAPVQAEAQRINISIEAQELDSALRQFARQTGKQILFSPELVKGRRSATVKGPLSPEEALRQLTRGSGLNVQQMPNGTYLLTAPEAFSPKAVQTASLSNVAMEEEAEGPPEIIVTARKRREAEIRVPVIATVLGGDQLETFQVANLTDVSARVPGLGLGSSVLTVGAQISLRGVGTSTIDAGVDQSVALNVDGLQLTHGLAYQAGMFDLAQIEVLKGPQALFFGKNSPGGVIAVRTADPGPDFEAIGRIGYEFGADETQAELILSGPVTPNLGVRLAWRFSDAKGYFRNEAEAIPELGGAGPRYGRFHPTRNHIVRGTVLWQPRDDFSAKLKINYTHDNAQGGGAAQLTSCPDGLGNPFGIPFFSPTEDCKLDRRLNVVDLDPAAFPGVRNGGVPFLTMTQWFGTLELNQKLAPGLDLTSVSGYYSNSSDGLINASSAGASGPALAADNNFERSDFTQELRLSSDFSSPINFMAGGFYQKSDVMNDINLLGNTALGLPGLLLAGVHNLDIESLSFFGQLRWTISPVLELTGGARWQHERRSNRATDLGTGEPLPVALAQPRISSKNWSPEFTIAYTPTRDLTLFAAFKQAYKSGSFSITVPSADGDNNSFGDEKVQGGEIGLKSRLFDRQLSLNLSAYYYKYSGLQVGVNEPAQEGLSVLRTINAGSAKVKGIEVDASYRPRDVDGLNLWGAANYNDAKFTDLTNVPCWGGQSIAEGCNLLRDSETGLFTSQDLSGLPLVRAPKWQANFGLDYEWSINDALAVKFAVANQVSSRYLANLGRRADFRQGGFLKTDLSLAFKDSTERWEFALIGNNIADRRTYGNCININYANGDLLGGQITGGTERGPAGVDEVACFVDRGREVWARLTLRL